MGINVKHIFTANIQVDDPIEVGNVGTGIRRVIPITGGTFSGPEIKGIVLPGGADYQMIRYDGMTEALAHYTIQTEEGVLIYVVNKGYRHGPKEIIERMIQGEEVPIGSYYFKTSPLFETGSEEYAFLNRNIFVGEGFRRPSDVQMKFYQVL
ncbi:DUF3237 domain-containing protein [Peribacillus butanolivorans]|uniref:DUF3237 domain-containing protein n=1 Tax=Peribacillus butanolivorans TaxID=421767 RepID=UPI002E2335B8|nr:DUF3237 domain-containing protein [Peribacillus butanolivorans]